MEMAGSIFVTVRTGAWDCAQDLLPVSAPLFASTFGTHLFLGAFAKLRKATVKFHVCPFVRLKQFGSHRTDFYEILYLSIVRKSIGKFKFE